MIEVTIKLSDTHRVVVADGCLAIEADGAQLYEEPLVLAYPKLEALMAAAGIARDEFSEMPMPDESYDESEFGVDD